MGKVEFGLGIGTGLLGATMALSGCGEAPTAPPSDNGSARRAVGGSGKAT